MMILVTYDVDFTTDLAAGAKRLRRLAKLCLDFGQRVQYSVFEIEVDPAQWTFLKNKLTQVMNQETDSIRLYYMGSNWSHKVEHIGAKKTLNLNGPLIF